MSVLVNEIPPIIVTAQPEPAAQQYFNALRTAHFPRAINYLDAHLTLFHKLPGDAVAAIKNTVQQYDDEFPCTAVATSLFSIGRGVAIAVDCSVLKDVRRGLSTVWADWLTPQDRQGSKKGFKPHITIQNKVDPADAKALLASLMSDFAPFEFQITGLALWHYLGGPWAQVE